MVFVISADFLLLNVFPVKKIISDLSFFRWVKIRALLKGPFSPLTFQLTNLAVSPPVITPLNITLLWVCYYFPFVKGRASVYPKQLWKK